MSEMQTKNQVEDSIIQESLLTCIDLANSDLHQSALLLKKACLDSGFFYVINHGISKEVTDKAFEQSKKFFALPLEEKMKVLKNEKHRGYTPLYDQIPDPENQVKGDHKEGYYIGSEVPRDDPQWDRPFYGLNTWPNPGISDPSKGVYGTGAHSDYGMITLLATDGVMGLQICKDRNAKLQKWEYVPSIEGAIVVNLGDMMERWSNGLFRGINRVKNALRTVKNGSGQGLRKVNPLVKGLPGQLLTRNQFDLTDRLTLTNFELTNQTGLTGQRVDTPSHWRVMKAGGGEATVWRRSGGGGLAEETAAKAAEMIANGGEWPALTRGGETSGGSSGFVRARIAVWSVATALSEEKNTMVAFNA
uniref:Fe2OG dioxygenase domain-containing protein n=1 Tax=Brassica campestris TaxID=3711 RepID=M4EYD0_BRACM